MDKRTLNFDYKELKEHMQFSGDFFRSNGEDWYSGYLFCMATVETFFTEKLKLKVVK